MNEVKRILLAVVIIALFYGTTMWIAKKIFPCEDPTCCPHETSEELTSVRHEQAHFILSGEKNGETNNNQKTK